MALIAEVHLSGDIEVLDHTFSEVPNVSCTVEDYHYLSTDGGRYYVFFGLCRNCDFEKLEAAMDGDDTVSSYHAAAEVDGRRLYRVETIPFRPDRPLLFPVCRKHDVTVLSAWRDTESLSLRARIPSRETLQQFSQDLGDIADRVTLARLYTEGQRPEADGRLTDRQREALALAFEAGYFETPSQATLEELATQFEVTPQALSDRIRSAVRTLVAEAVDEDPSP